MHEGVLLDIEGLLKIKTDFREKDMIDKMSSGSV